MLIFSANVNAKRGEVAEIQSVSALPIQGTRNTYYLYLVDYRVSRAARLSVMAMQPNRFCREQR